MEGKTLPLGERFDALQKRGVEASKFIKILRYGMKKLDFEACACGGFHYVGKDNYHAYRCPGCQNLFCNGMTTDYLDENSDDEASEIVRLNEELAYKCEYALCEGCTTDVQGSCPECFKDGRSNLSYCAECDEYWCCPEHKGCECDDEQ
jgi:hypothetical protein